MVYDEESQKFNKRRVSHPWIRGKNLVDAGWGEDVPMFTACDSEGEFFAVKEVHLAGHDSKSEREKLSTLLQEIDILSRLAHDNIVQYMGYERVREKLYVFRELVSEKSLSSVYKDFENLSEKQISGYTRHILKGLEYLHDRSIVHRDIRCGNIVVDGYGTCKIADFGFAKELINSLSDRDSHAGTIPWMAPEAFDPEKVQTCSADIWSLGCTVIEMASKSPPYGQLEQKAIIHNIRTGVVPPIPKQLSAEAKNFIEKCLQVDQDKRPTASELLQHAFITPSNDNWKTSEIQVTVKKLLHEIAQELESFGAEVYHLNGEWVGGLNVEDREKIQVKFWNAGYLQTVATDTDICYEKITLGIPIGLANISSGNQLADAGTAEDKTLLENQASSNQQPSKDEVHIFSSTTASTSQVFKSNSGSKVEVSEAALQIKEPKLSGCTQDCQLLPLKVTLKKKNDELENKRTRKKEKTNDELQGNLGASTSTNQVEAQINGYYAEFKDQGRSTSIWSKYNCEEDFHAEICLSCCIDAKQVCIKVTHLAGQINNATSGTVLEEMRVTLGATIGGQKIILILDNIDENGRVIRRAKARHTYILEKREHDLSLQIAPSLSIGIASVSASIGELNLNPRPEAKDVIFETGKELDLVVLKPGERACQDIKMSTVLLLQRNLEHTWLAGSYSEKTALAMRGNPDPVILIGEFNPSLIGKPMELKITCCVQLEVTFLDALASEKGKENIIKALLVRGTRKSKVVEFSNSGHAVFEGIIHPSDSTTTK